MSALLLFVLVSAVWTMNAAALDPTSARGYVKVTDYGAYNDGTNATATTTAIQSAIDYAYSNNKVVYFPEGTYAINNTLECSNVCATSVW